MAAAVGGARYVQSPFQIAHQIQVLVELGAIAGAEASVELGELIEYGKTSEIFTNPREKRTEDYVTGRFG